MRKTIPSGSIINGTHRPQDLVPCFVDFLNSHGGKDYNPADLPWPEDDHDWWESDRSHYFLYEELWLALEDLAPEGYTFGTHPGDGSDFGYWPDDSYELGQVGWTNQGEVADG